MEELIERVLESASVRALIEGICVKIIADLFHRRATDPDFLIHSDAAFAAVSSAQTPEALNEAQKSLLALMSST